MCPDLKIVVLDNNQKRRNAVKLSFAAVSRNVSEVETSQPRTASVSGNYDMIVAHKGGNDKAAAEALPLCGGGVRIWYSGSRGYGSDESNREFKIFRKVTEDQGITVREAELLYLFSVAIMNGRKPRLLKLFSDVEATPNVNALSLLCQAYLCTHFVAMDCDDHRNCACLSASRQIGRSCGLGQQQLRSGVKDFSINALKKFVNIAAVKNELSILGIDFDLSACKTVLQDQVPPQSEYSVACKVLLELHAKLDGHTQS
jgi:hypothetical protein